MARRATLEDQLAALGALREAPGGLSSPEAVAQLEAALAGRSSHAAARAAALAGGAELSVLTGALVAAFERFMKGAAADKGCTAKTAIAEALYRIGAGSAEAQSVYLRGIGHVQMEPVFGGRVDTAVDLRGSCAMGLVRMNYPGVMPELAALLADTEAGARAAAARAMGYRGHDDAAALLRFKVLTGDDDAGVMTEAVLALLLVSPAESLPFAAGLLDAGRDEQVQEAAALALGQSRLPGALEVLRGWWDRTLDAGLRRVAMTAMAMLRTDASLAFLIEQIAEGAASTAGDAAAALAIYRHDPALGRRVREAAGKRGDGALDRIVAETFG